MQLTKCLFFVVVLLVVVARLFSIFIAASEGSAEPEQHLLWVKSWQHAKVWHSFLLSSPSFSLSPLSLCLPPPSVYLRTRPVGSFLCYFLPTSQSEYKQKTVSKFPASDKARVARAARVVLAWRRLPWWSAFERIWLMWA